MSRRSYASVARDSSSSTVEKKIVIIHKCRPNIGIPRVRSATSTEQKLCTVAGQITIGEDSVTILRGTGFTAVSVSPGVAKITLTNPAIMNATVTATSDLAGFGAFVEAQMGTMFNLVTGTGGTVNFIAVGPCPPS